MPLENHSMVAPAAFSACRCKDTGSVLLRFVMVISVWHDEVCGCDADESLSRRLQTRNVIRGTACQRVRSISVRLGSTS